MSTIAVVVIFITGLMVWVAIACVVTIWWVIEPFLYSTSLMGFRLWATYKAFKSFKSVNWCVLGRLYIRNWYACVRNREELTYSIKFDECKDRFIWQGDFRWKRKAEK